MRRVICVAVAVTAAVAPTVGASAASSPRAELTKFVCRHSANAARSKLAITAVMRPLSGTQHMAIKFSLLRRPAGGSSFAQVYGGDLDQWISPPNATLGQRPDDVWELDKVVSGLAAPAAYRLRVEFRWRGAGGRVLGRATRLTPVCRQPQ